MFYDYEKLYATETAALGDQTPAIAKVLADLAMTSGRVLDIGCGQGRDALPLARAGCDVTGVDLAPSGVAQMCDTATAEGLNITGHVADITTYDPDGAFDILLIDRTLHMLDSDARATTFARLLDHVAPNGWLVLADEPSNMPNFRATLSAQANWAITQVNKGLLSAQRRD